MSPHISKSLLSYSTLGILLLAYPFHVQLSRDRTVLAREQTKNSVKPKNSESQAAADVRAVVDMTAGVPPEFAADALIRLVESKKVRNKKLEAELLVDAFYRAEMAQHKLKLQTLAHDSDTGSAYASRAFELNMDTVSLRARAAVALLPIDSKRSRDLFQEIAFPQLGPLRCEDALVYDFVPYYRALAGILREGFSAKERLEGRDLEFLRFQLGNLQFNAQIAPLADLLSEIVRSREQGEQFADLFALAVVRLHSDPRSFAATVTRFDAIGPLIALVSKLESTGARVPGLVQAIRGYIVSNFKEKGCQDATGGVQSSSLLPPAALRYNKWLSAKNQNYGIAPISAAELALSDDGAGLTDSPFWQTLPAKDLLAREQKLHFPSGNVPLSKHDRESISWNTELKTFMNSLESWNETDDKPAAAFFHEKGVLYYGLIRLVPDGRARLRVIKGFVDFLALNPMQKLSYIEWFFHVQDLLSAIDSLPPIEKQEARQALLDSHDPILILYGRLDAITSGKMTDAVALAQALTLRVLADRIEEQKEPAETVTVSIEVA